MLWNGSKPAGLPAFPQSSYLYCFIAILTEIPVLMPHLKLSWQGPGMAKRKPGGVWWGQASWLPARTPAPSPHPGEHAAVLQPPVWSTWQGNLSPPGWGPVQRYPGMPILGKVQPSGTRHHSGIQPFLGRRLPCCRGTRSSPFPATIGDARIHGECGSSSPAPAAAAWQELRYPVWQGLPVCPSAPTGLQLASLH